MLHSSFCLQPKLVGLAAPKHRECGCAPQTNFILGMDDKSFVALEFLATDETQISKARWAGIFVENRNQNNPKLHQERHCRADRRNMPHLTELDLFLDLVLQICRADGAGQRGSGRHPACYVIALTKTDNGEFFLNI
jgi:hypothetical protein